MIYVELRADGDLMCMLCNAAFAVRVSKDQELTKQINIMRAYHHHRSVCNSATRPEDAERVKMRMLKAPSALCNVFHLLKDDKNTCKAGGFHEWTPMGQSNDSAFGLVLKFHLLCLKCRCWTYVKSEFVGYKLCNFEEEVEDREVYREKEQT